jgi:CubicO group peptidase (beta-lactamase class C family)
VLSSRREILAALASTAVLGACGGARAGSATTASTAPPTTAPPATAEPSQAAWDPAGVERLRAFVADRATSQFLVVEDGRTVLSWTADDALATRDVASVQKSITALLVGRAVQDGLVSVDDPVASHLGPTWAAESEGAVTVMQLLTMTSGLGDDLVAQSPPGERWYYNTPAYAQLHGVLEAVTGMALDELAAQWLFEPIGADVARFVRRRGLATSAFAAWGLQSDVGDLVKVGQVVLDGGRPVIADRDWIETVTSTSQTSNESYGALWWLNGKAGGLLPGPAAPSFTGPLVPSAPADMVAALGRDDQKLYVVPSERLIVARLGERAGNRTANALSSFDDELWQHIADARR